MIAELSEFSTSIKLKISKAWHILIQQGPAEFIRRVRIKIGTRLLANQIPANNSNNTVSSLLDDKSAQKSILVRQLLHERFENLQPIRSVRTSRDAPRFNIVTDSIKKNSLFGGVATSLILDALCKQIQRPPEDHYTDHL